MLRRISLATRLFIAACFASLLLPALALADTVDPGQSFKLLLPTAQLNLIVVGAFVPLVTYVLNKIAPWTGQGVKAFVTVIASAAAAGAYQAIDVGNFGWNSETLQFIATAVVATLAAHHWLWKPSGIQAKLAEPEHANLPRKV